MSAVPTIHRFPVEHEGAFVNAYLVETASGVVAVDGLLHVSAAKEMRAGIERLGKPLLAALLTHSHPDHYAGLGEIVAGREVPIYAPQGVIDTITADDALKDQIVGPFFGEEWPENRVFPNTAIADGESVSFDEVTFTVIDLGPSESPHDSPWILGDDERIVSSAIRSTSIATATWPMASTRNGCGTSRRSAPASPTMPSSTSGTADRSGTRCGTGSASTSSGSSRPSRALTGRTPIRRRGPSSAG